MAFYLAEEALRNNDQAEAYRLYTRAYQLHPLPRYEKMIEQTRRDTTTG